jgi:hypothetical protein
VQLFLEVLVHHVDHAVAESPQEKEGGDEDEGEDQAFAVGPRENAGLVPERGGRIVLEHVSWVEFVWIAIQAAHTGIILLLGETDEIGVVD